MSPRIFGLMMVRNEAELLAVNLLHHLESAGLERVYVVDDGSSDDTALILERFASSGRVHWLTHRGEFAQAAVITDLARQAYLNGADWVVSIDADEFWTSRSGDLRNELSVSPEIGALSVDVVNFLQSVDQNDSSARALLNMTRRVEKPVGPLTALRSLCESESASYIELMYPRKWISRAALTLDLHEGSHSVNGVTGRCEETSEIVCLHAPLRSREVMTRKAGEVASRTTNVNPEPDLSWHLKRWSGLTTPEQREREWRANSFHADGALHSFGHDVPLVEDLRLQQIVSRQLGKDFVTPGASGFHPTIRPFGTLVDLSQRKGASKDAPIESTDRSAAGVRAFDVQIRELRAELHRTRASSLQLIQQLEQQAADLDFERRHTTQLQEHLQIVQSELQKTRAQVFEILEVLDARSLEGQQQVSRREEVIQQLQRRNVEYEGRLLQAEADLAFAARERAQLTEHISILQHDLDRTRAQVYEILGVLESRTRELNAQISRTELKSVQPKGRQ